MIIAVDFDGTCVKHRYPMVGEDVDGAVSVLKELVRKGHKIILYTMRSGDTLDDAISWFIDNDIELWGINRNPEQLGIVLNIKTLLYHFKSPLMRMQLQLLIRKHINLLGYGSIYNNFLLYFTPHCLHIIRKVLQ